MADKITDPAASYEKLLNTLSQYLGDEIASAAIKARKDRNIVYGAPVDAKGRYTAYGTLRNLDVSPENYMPDPETKVTIIPRDRWNDTAGGRYSILGGIQLPSVPVNFPLEQALVHEGQHARDAKSASNSLNLRPGDNERLQKVGEELRKQTSGAVTGRTSIGEVIPELLDFSSRNPAGTPIQATDLFKVLSQDLQAFILRKLYPMPADVDAMVGQSFNK